MYNPILSRRLAIQKAINNSFNNNANIEIFDEEAIQNYKNDLTKALDSNAISKDDFEKGMKDVSHLQKKVITNKDGHQQTVYVKGAEAEKPAGEVNANGIMQKKELTQEDLEKVAPHKDKLSHINRVRFDKLYKEKSDKKFEEKDESKKEKTNISVAMGDHSYRKLDLAIKGYEQESKTGGKGGSSIVKLNQNIGGYVVTTNKRAAAFEKEGTGTIMNIDEIYPKEKTKEERIKETKQTKQSEIDKLYEKASETEEGSKKFFDVVGKHYTPEDDGESEYTMLKNLNKLPEEKKKKILLALKPKRNKPSAKYDTEEFKQKMAEEYNKPTKPFFSLKKEENSETKQDEDSSKKKVDSALIDKIIKSTKDKNFYKDFEEHLSDGSFEEAEKLGLNKNDIFSLYAYKKLSTDENLGEEYTKSIDSALNKLPDFKKEVYRVAKLKKENLKNYKSGGEITFDQLTSSTKDQTIFDSDDYGYSDDWNVKYEIKSKTGKDISMIADMGESEVLFKSKTKFKVEKVEQTEDEDTDKKFHLIKMTEL